MKPYYILLEAIQAIKINALRSGLTIVGIVVGIFSVTAMLALGEGLTGNITERFNSFSNGDITISGELSPIDLTWVTGLPYVKAAVGIQSVQGAKVIASNSEFSPSIQTVVGNYETIKSIVMVSGETFNFANPEFNEQVVVVDEGFAEAFKNETGAAALGQTIILNGQSFEIIGVQEGGTGGFGRRGDGSVLVPYQAALGIVSSTKQFSSVAVALQDTQYYEISAQHILESLNSSRNAEKSSEDYFAISSAQDTIETAQETATMLSLFLGIVGAIALFVGGIGTMNMMLTTVTERTKEIGLRKAIGARASDITLQILAESVMLTCFGGAIGIALTYLASLVANQVFAESNIISVVMSNTVVMYAALVSVAVGVVFGVYPARNAAALQPVEALRAE